MSETNGPEAIPDSWKLPQGMRVSEASRRISDADKRLLHKQAYDQAGNFEVLNKRDVASLSRVSCLQTVCRRTSTKQNDRNSEHLMNAAIISARLTSRCAQVARSFMVA